MRIMRALLLLMALVALALLAGCGGGGGPTPPDPTDGTVTVDSTQQKVFYTPPATRPASRVYAYFRNTISAQTVSGEFDAPTTSGKWTLDISTNSDDFGGPANGDYDMTTWVIYLDDSTETPHQIGDSILVHDLDILGGSGPPPPPF